MEKGEINELIANAAKTIFSFCRARTDSKEEAEDLSQDIIFKLLKTEGSFVSEKKFYAFMWVVAGNVYKDWYKKRKKVNERGLDDEICDKSILPEELLEKESVLKLLHRELGLLTEQYRNVIIQYYFNGLKVSEISKSLKISESMVKFLLFKSRKILKEGISMERTKGDLSFNPRRMDLALWGNTKDKSQSYWDLCGGNLMAQNILLACYNDRCTAEEISIQIGVAVPYLEKDLQKLCGKNILIQKGGKYETNIVIFTKDFLEEADEKTLPIKRGIAQLIEKFLNQRFDEIKSIGFHTGVEDDGLLKWHVAGMLLWEAVLEKYEKGINPVFPTKYPGIEAFVWGVEEYQSRYGSSGNVGDTSNAHGDFIRILKIDTVGGMDCGYIKNNKHRVNIALDIARGKTTGFSENDMSEAAEFIKHGIAKKTGEKLTLKIPVFTNNQYSEFLSLTDNATNAIAEKARELVSVTTEILIQHTPVSMKKDAESMIWLKGFDAVFEPAAIMLESKILQKIPNPVYPTSYVILAE
ncbi:MAG: sigma-70 family RNA polymerase sigma factor [Clostridiales bacterium]|nr:sigma-70 family RNA polymerase sigma factor [Clostridiales bacterium]